MLKEYLDWEIESVYETATDAKVNVLCPGKVAQKTLDAICKAVDEFTFPGKKVEMMLFTWPSLGEFLNLNSNEIH